MKTFLLTLFLIGTLFCDISNDVLTEFTIKNKTNKTIKIEIVTDFPVEKKEYVINSMQEEVIPFISGSYEKPSYFISEIKFKDSNNILLIAFTNINVDSLFQEISKGSYLYEFGSNL